MFAGKFPAVTVWHTKLESWHRVTLLSENFNLQRVSDSFTVHMTHNTTEGSQNPDEKYQQQYWKLHLDDSK